MPKLPKIVTPMTAFRMGRGQSMRDVAAVAKVSVYTVGKLEKGKPVLRINAARYFQSLGIDLNDRKTWPEQIKIIEEGGSIVVSSKA